MKHLRTVVALRQASKANQLKAKKRHAGETARGRKGDTIRAAVNSERVLVCKVKVFLVNV